jgi:hypothetical protein
MREIHRRLRVGLRHSGHQDLELESSRRQDLGRTIRANILKTEVQLATQSALLASDVDCDDWKYDASRPKVMEMASLTDTK